MSIEELWPDPDRREEALTRIACVLATGGRLTNGRRHPYRLVMRTDTLTACELQTLQAYSVGCRRREAAALLGVSPETISKSLLRARLVLRAKNTTHACSEALRRGLIQ